MYIHWHRYTRSKSKSLDPNLAFLRLTTGYLRVKFTCFGVFLWNLDNFGLGLNRLKWAGIQNK